jgi:hypothetical protein
VEPSRHGRSSGSCSASSAHQTDHGQPAGQITLSGISDHPYPNLKIISTTSPTRSAICNTARCLECNALRSSHADRRLIDPKQQPARSESCAGAWELPPDARLLPRPSLFALFEQRLGDGRVAQAVAGIQMVAYNTGVARQRHWRGSHIPAGALTTGERLL